MDALTQRVTLVRTEAERLQDYLGTLSPAAWHYASACAGCEVGDVVAHLIRGCGGLRRVDCPRTPRGHGTAFTLASG